MKKNNISNVIWKDKKRIFGIPCTFTNYFIENNRLYIKTGFFSTQTDEVILYRILDIKSSQSLFQKLFKVGTVILYCADQNNRTLELKNIKNPIDMHKFISNLVEKERQNKGIIGREMFGSANIDMDHTDGLCDTGEHLIE